MVWALGRMWFHSCCLCYIVWWRKEHDKKITLNLFLKRVETFQTCLGDEDRRRTQLAEDWGDCHIDLYLLLSRVVSYSGPHLTLLLLDRGVTTTPSRHSPATPWCSPDLLTAELCIRGWLTVFAVGTRVYFTTATRFRFNLRDLHYTNVLLVFRLLSSIQCLYRFILCREISDWLLCQRSVCNILLGWLKAASNVLIYFQSCFFLRFFTSEVLTRL